MKRTGFAVALAVCNTFAHAAPLSDQGYFPFNLGAGGQDYGKAIAVDADDNVLVAALYNQTLDTDPSKAGTNLVASAGGTDIVIAKYTSYGSLLWARSMGGGGAPPSIDAPHAIITDRSNQVYVAGYFGSAAANGRASDFDPGPGVSNLTTISGYDAFFAKYDPNGALLWALRLGDTNLTFGEERAWDLALDEEDNIYISGAFGGTVNFNPLYSDARWVTNPGSGSGLFLAKYTPAGSNLWARGFGANIASIFNEGYTTVAPDRSGHCWLAGNFRATCDFDLGGGVSNLTSRGNTDIFLVRYGTNGLFDAVYQMGGTGQDVVSPGAMRCKGGPVYLTGRFGGTADVDPGPANSNLTASGGNNIFLASYGSNGTLRWAINMPTSGETTGQGGHRVALDDATNCFVTGWSGGTTDFNPDPGITSNLVAHSTNAADVFLAKYSANGALLWAHGFGSVNPGTNDTNIGAGLALDAKGNAVITGQFYGPEADFDPSTNSAALTSAGANDCFVAKYSAEGERVRGDELRLRDLQSPAPGQVSLRWFALRDVSYSVLASSNLLSTNGTVQTTLTSSSDGYLVQTNEPGADAQRFFAVQVP
jgi:hypothetical protein